MIALKDLTVTAGDFRLDGITLDAGDGEYVVVLGPSGAGKTVLLEAIGGLRRPDTGSIIIDSRNMAGIPPEERGTVLVYQDYSLFPHMTAAENIAYGLKIRKRPEYEIRGRVDHLLADFGISLIRDRYPGSLSGGEQQRVAIARALAMDPSVLLLDEPFASLDPVNRNDCIRVMQEIKSTRSVTVIQVSHSGEEAYALADKVVVLLGGNVMQEGTPDDIFLRPGSLAVARFIGLENILTGTVSCDNTGRSRLIIGSAEIHLPGEHPSGSPVTIGIAAGCVRVGHNQIVSDDNGSNEIICRISSVILGRDTVTFKLNGTIPLISVMPRTAFDGDVHSCGMQVNAVFRDSDVHVVKGA